MTRVLEAQRNNLLMVQAKAVACEHVLWAAEDRQTPRSVLMAVGIDWPRHSEPDWEDCIRGLALAWYRLKTTQVAHRMRRRAA